MFNWLFKKKKYKRREWGEQTIIIKDAVEVERSTRKFKNKKSRIVLRRNLNLLDQINAVKNDPDNVVIKAECNVTPGYYGNDIWSTAITIHRKMEKGSYANNWECGPFMYCTTLWELV